MNKLRLGLFLILFFGWVGSSWAGLSEGVTAYGEGDYKTAFNELMPLAQQGDFRAQYILGNMYKNGSGVLQDYKKAVKWYRLAAKQGLAFAQYGLGVMYSEGEGVLQDDKKAVKWYRLAAEQGDARAQKNLGIMYVGGTGVLQDYILGHMWANLAAYNGGENAKELREFITKKLNANQITKAQKLAQQCLDSNYKNCG